MINRIPWFKDLFGRAIVASPEKLNIAADNAKSLIECIVGNMQSLDKIVSSTNYFWNSESSEALSKNYETDKIDYDDIRQRLYVHIEHLNQIAEMYRSAEESSTEDTTALPDTIFK